MELSKEIANWIKGQVESANKKGIVVGLSGGVDSAAVAVLSKKALGQNVLGLILSCKSSSQDENLALKVAKKFDIKTERVVLDDVFDKLVGVFPEADNMAKANLKPRLRMCILYYFANTLDYLVAGTGNKSELVVGYFTKHGDGGVDILPLGGLLKTEVRDLAKALGIPDEIVNRAPSAGLWHGQTDEGEMGITYDELDKVIKALEEDRVKGIDENSLLKVEKMMKGSEHKRAKVPIFSR
jgi:NAD+ synthase